MTAALEQIWSIQALQVLVEHLLLPGVASLAEVDPNALTRARHDGA